MNLSFLYGTVDVTNKSQDTGGVGFYLYGAPYVQLLSGIIYNRSLTSTLSLAQAIGLTHLESPTSVLSLSQQVSLIHRRDYSASNSLSLSQTLARGLTSLQSPSSALSLSQTVVDIHRGRGDTSNTLTLTEVVGVTHYWKIDVGQSIFISQSATDSASYLRTVNQALSLVEVANLSRDFHVSQSLTLTELVSFIYSKFASNVLALTQTVSLKRTINLEVNDTTLVPVFAGSPPHPQISGMSQTVSLKRTLNKTITSIFGPSQHVSSVLSHAQQASNTLTLHQEMYQIRTDENEPQALAISQAVAVQKIIIKSVHQVLALGQTPHINGTPITLSVTQTLVFKQLHARPTGIPLYPIVTIPSAYVVKVPDVRPSDTLCYPYRGSLTLLEIQSSSVILPTAEFNDSQSYNGNVVIKRAMNGKRRIYHRKMGIAQKLHYDFIIDRRKAIELRQFLIQANSVPIKLTNWKGEVWQVVLTNNPLTFTEESYWGPGVTQSSGNKSSISLEFEGARIN